MGFSEVDNETQRIFNETRDSYFSELANCNLKLLFNSKKKKKANAYVIGQIKKANDLVKYFAETDNGEELDFIIFLDENIFMNLTEDDKKRILRHELRHILYDSNAKTPYTLKEHDVTDFYEEIEINKDDSRWMERVNEIAFSVYEEE